MMTPRFFAVFAALLVMGLALAPARGLAEPLVYRLSPQQSEIVTEIAHPFGAVKGRFQLRDGVAEGDPNDLPGTGRVRLAVDTASYDSGLGIRDGDVRDNYLEAGQHPTIRFTGSRVEKVASLKAPYPTWSFTVVGILELHGVKREVEIPVKAALQEKRIVAEGSAKILLKDYNIPIPSFLFLRSGESVEVRFRFVGEPRP